MADPRLTKILNTSVEIDVVDIGANPIDEVPPYVGLLKDGLSLHIPLSLQPNPALVKGAAFLAPTPSCPWVS